MASESSNQTKSQLFVDRRAELDVDVPAATGRR
jgi:hypothetical protein